MKSLQTLATNPFLAAMEAASGENNIEFADDTAARIEADNPNGIYTSEVVDLKKNIQKYKMGVTKAQIGEREATTKGVEDMEKIVAETGRRLYAALQADFGVKAAALLVFFPKGLTGVSEARRGDYSIIIDNWVDKAAKHPYIDKLGQPWKDELDKLQGDWATAVSTQSGAKEDVEKGGSDAESLIAPMAQNLWNLLLLVIQNNQPNAQDVVNNYFNTTPLEHREHKDKDGLGRTFGTAKDAAGIGMPEVHIVAKDANGQIIWKGKTDGEGKWRTKNIMVGMYHLVFEKPGYVTQTISHEFLDAHDTEVDVVLVAG